MDGGRGHRPRRRVPLDIRLLLRIFVVNSSCHIVPYISLPAPTLYIFLFLLFHVLARVSLAGSGGRVKGSRMVGRSARTQPEFKSKRLRRRPPTTELEPSSGGDYGFSPSRFNAPSLTPPSLPFPLHRSVKDIPPFPPPFVLPFGRRGEEEEEKGGKGFNKGDLLIDCGFPTSAPFSPSLLLSPFFPKLPWSTVKEGPGGSARNHPFP